LRSAVKRKDPFPCSTDLLTHLLQDQGDVLANIVRQVTQKVDAIEDAIVASRLSLHRSELGQLRRVMVRLARLLAPEPAALFRLLQHPPAWIRPDQIHRLRESTEEFSVVLGDLSSLQERIRLLQEEIAAQVAEANNHSIFILTIVSVLALPINLTAGLMGMNVGGIPWADDPRGFWLVVGLVLSITALGAWAIARTWWKQRFPAQRSGLGD
jgi:zinc transporter